MRQSIIVSRKNRIVICLPVGTMDGVFQRGNKIKLDGVVVQNHSLQLKGTNFTILGYMSIENTGNSYNVKPLADNHGFIYRRC